MPAGASDGPRYGEMFPRYGSDVPTLRVHASHVTGPVPPGGAAPPSPNGPNETEMRLEGIPMHSVYNLENVNKHITHSESIPCTAFSATFSPAQHSLAHSPLYGMVQSILPCLHDGPCFRRYLNCFREPSAHALDWLANTRRSDDSLKTRTTIQEHRFSMPIEDCWCLLVPLMHPNALSLHLASCK